MKAVIFLLIVLLGVDLSMYHGEHLHRLRENTVAVGDSIGSWVFTPG